MTPFQVLDLETVTHISSFFLSIFFFIQLRAAQGMALPPSANNCSIAVM
jgi:hypothetical protein